MKTIAYVLGILAILVAIVYFLVPADSLPSFMPGHLAGSSHVHLKHGVVAVVVGVVLLGIGSVIGRRA
jgi:hypothetical protein